MTPAFNITRRLATVLVPAALLVALTGCEDPTSGKPKATVSSAAPAPKDTGAAKAPAAKASAAPGGSAAAPAGSGAAAAPAGDAVEMPVDAASSTVGFVGSKVTGKHEGKFQKFTGSISVAGGQATKIAFEVETASVKTDADKLDTHLQAPDFFDSAKFPKATFTSTAIKAGGEGGATHTISGDLELRGVKKNISFPATIHVSADAADGTAEFSINRKDFGITIAGKTDDLIRDDVLLKLSLKAKKK